MLQSLLVIIVSEIDSVTVSLCCSWRLFISKEAAAHAYNEAAKKFFGEFAILNFPEQA